MTEDAKNVAIREYERIIYHSA